MACSFRFQLDHLGKKTHVRRKDSNMSKLKTMCAMIFQDTVCWHNVHIKCVSIFNRPFHTGCWGQEEVAIYQKSRTNGSKGQRGPVSTHSSFHLTLSLSLSRSLSVVDFRQRRRNKKKIWTPRLQKLTNMKAQRTRKWRKS